MAEIDKSQDSLNFYLELKKFFNSIPLPNVDIRLELKICDESLHEIKKCLEDLRELSMKDSEDLTTQESIKDALLEEEHLGLRKSMLFFHGEIKYRMLPSLISEINNSIKKKRSE